MCTVFVTSDTVIGAIL